MLSVLAVALAAALVIGYLIAQPFYRVHLRKKIRQRPFPEDWRTILRERVPYLRKLPADLQLQLKQHIQVFITEKEFVGCQGVIITDEMRVTVAAYACLLLLNRSTDYYPTLRQILIYPGPFITNRAETDAAGVIHQQRRILAGESWTQGQVILSWEDVVEASALPADGRNVVIHEFAHQLDQEKGYANGAPFLAHRDHYSRWAEVFNQHFNTLRQQTEQQLPTLLNTYAAQNPAEFFAVASELFFAQPAQLATGAPDLYRELQRYYRVDPMVW